MGQVLRLYQLCTKPADIEAKLHEFFGYLLDRGFQATKLILLFDQGITNALDFISCSPEYRKQLKAERASQDRRRVFLNLHFHSDDPSSSKIQTLWRQLVQNPEGKPALNQIELEENVRVPIDRLTVAYSRAPNIGNLLSYRKIDKQKGPKVPSFWD